MSLEARNNPPEFDGSNLNLEQAAYLIRTQLEVQSEGEHDSLERRVCSTITVIGLAAFELGGEMYNFERRTVNGSNAPRNVLLRDDRDKDSAADYVIMTPHCCGLPWDGYSEDDMADYADGNVGDLNTFIYDLMEEYGYSTT